MSDILVIVYLYHKFSLKTYKLYKIKPFDGVFLQFLWRIIKIVVYKSNSL